MANTDTERNTSATNGYLIPDGWETQSSGGVTDAYTKAETDALLAKKADNSVLANYATIPELGSKAEINDVYTKEQADALHEALSTDLYHKAETNALLSLKVDKTQLEADYTNNTNLKKQLNEKVSTADLNNAIAQRKEEQKALQDSVLATSADLQSQITTMQSKLTESSNTMESSLTAMQTSLTTTANNINARYDELVANVTSVSSQLTAKDNDLQAQITELDEVIPTAATADNQLADKAFVEDLVKKGAARAISADADGAGFESLTALSAGPWYSLGEPTTPAVNDYAVVKKDATHNNNDVRYNFDGAVWVFFQEFSSGGGTLDLTTAQTNALNSGITSAKVAQIDSNFSSLTAEISRSKDQDTQILARIATEESTRETAVNNLTAALSAEKLARENADNQNTAAIESEAAARGAADNSVKAYASQIKTDLENTIGELATLNTDVTTSIVAALNDMHDELHNERLACDGSNQMNAQLDIVLTGTGDLLLMKAGDKGVNFRLDANTGFMSIVPESAPTTGFEVSANTLKPRTSAIAYSLGDNSNYFTNAYITNLNGMPVSSYFTPDNAYTKEQIDSKVSDLDARVAVLEAKGTPKALYFFLPEQQLLLSSQQDKYATGFETNLDVSQISVTYAESGKSTITFESQTLLKIHYVTGSTQNAKFTLTYNVTGETIGVGYLCTGYNGGNSTKILWTGVSS